MVTVHCTSCHCVVSSYEVLIKSIQLFLSYAPDKENCNGPTDHMVTTIYLIPTLFVGSIKYKKIASTINKTALHDGTLLLT